MFKAIAILLVLILTLPVSLAAGVTAYLLQGGLAMVRVDTDDLDLTLPVPTRLIDVSLGVAGLAIPDEERRQWLEALPSEDFHTDLEELIRALAESPDGVFVAVETGSESVLVAKRRGTLRVEVDSSEAHVVVTVPARALARVAGHVAEFAFPD